MQQKQLTAEEIAQEIPGRLGGRSLVLIGMMGAGKTAAGRYLARVLDLPFVDSDHEIEEASGLSVQAIFEEYGEAYFRSGEKRVIARLLTGGPQVLAAGGGAFMDLETREQIKAKGISLWLKTPLPVLLKRLRNKGRKIRPLLQGDDFEKVLENLVNIRYPIYAEADVVVESAHAHLPHVAFDILEKLFEYLQQSQEH